MTTVTISIPESLRKFVDMQIERRGFGNVSEYFRALVREQKEKEADRQLEALLLEGLESGEDITVTPAFWKELKAETAAPRSIRRNSVRGGSGEAPRSDYSLSCPHGYRAVRTVSPCTGRPCSGGTIPRRS